MPGPGIEDVAWPDVDGADAELVGTDCRDNATGEYEAGRTGRGNYQGERTGRGSFEAERTGRGDLDTENRFTDTVTDQLTVAEKVRREQIDVEAHTRGCN